MKILGKKNVKKRKHKIKIKKKKKKKKKNNGRNIKHRIIFNKLRMANYKVEKWGKGEG